MSTKMKQVTQQDFEVLTKYHPGEVRYYVDTSVELRYKHKGARVNVRREPVAKKASKKAIKKVTKKRAINGTGKGTNKPVLLTGVKSKFGATAKIGNAVETAVRSIYERDPTQVVGRHDLTDMVVRKTGLKIMQVSPVISDLISNHVLRYKPAPITLGNKA